MTYSHSKQCRDQCIAVLTAVVSRDIPTKLLERHMTHVACTISALQCHWQLRHVTSQHLSHKVTQLAASIACRNRRIIMLIAVASCDLTTLRW